MRECSKCGKSKPVAEFYRNPTCKDGLSYRCKECNRAYERLRHRTWYRKKHKEAQRRYHRKLKQAAIDAYGGKCECCKERRIEFLEIHPTGGGGRKLRTRLNVHMSQHLRQTGYPKGKYSIRCANCNSAIELYGYCPHKK